MKARDFVDSVDIDVSVAVLWDDDEDVFSSLRQSPQQSEALASDQGVRNKSSSP